MKRVPVLSASAVAAVLLSGIAPPQQAVALAQVWEASSEIQWIDDSDLKEWSYTGDWTHASGEPWTAENEGGTESYARAPGARATVQFTGTAFDLVGPRGGNGGRFRVTVDCIEQYTGSAYTPWKKYGEELLSVDGLPYGLHTVVIEALGTHEQGSSDDWVMIDGLAVYDDGPADPNERWLGAEGTREAGEAVELRMPGCGAASSLVDLLKARTTGGWFGVPGAGETWGAVNGHSVVTPQGVAGGPVITGGLVHEAATIPLDPGAGVFLEMTLPDAPRTALFTVAADERLGQPTSFAVVGGDGWVLPARLVRDTAAGVTEQRVAEVVTLTPGEIVLVAVDLADESGVGVHSQLSLYAASATGQPAELDIFEGRTTHVSAARIVSDYGVSASGPTHEVVPFSHFRHGPVVLSRVLADSAASAWTGDQNSRPGSTGDAVPLTFGETTTGARLSVGGVAQPHDAIGIRLPEDGSSVHLAFETGRQCRALTASVGIDDSTPSRGSASVRLEAYAAGQLLSMTHNGTWAYAPHSAVKEWFGSTDPLTPVTQSVPRQYLTEQLWAAKLAMGAHEFKDDPASLKAYTALVNRQWEELAATIEDPAMSLMTYPIDGALVLGAGSNALLDETEFQIGELTLVPTGPAPHTVPIEPIDPFAAFPVSIDLAEPHLMKGLRMAARGTAIPLAQVQSPLARQVDLVLSGTPGATVVLAGAGLDCVSRDVSANVFPLWSQIGVQPAFLPMPLDGDNKALEMLVFNPMWWDAMCPAGPSTTVGVTFPAQKTRETVWGSFDAYQYLDEGKTTEVATAIRPACGLPADQRNITYSEFELTDDSDGFPGDGYFVVRQDVIDPIASQLIAVDGSFEDRAVDWWRNTYRTTMHQNPAVFLLWLALAPFDLPAAIVMNPFVMNGLPESFGIAAGLAFLPMGLGEATEAALASGGSVVSSAARPLEASNELLLGNAEAHAAQAASGERATLTLGEQRLSVPVRTGESGEPIADIGSHTTSSTVVATDRAVSRMPVVSDHASWVADEATEARAICSRGLDPACTTPFPDAGTQPNTNPPTWVDEALVAGDPPLAAHDASSYWTLFPQEAAQLQSEIRNPQGAWIDPNAAIAWQQLQTDAEVFLGQGNAGNFMNSLRAADVGVAPVAVRTSNETLYAFVRLPVDQGFEAAVDEVFEHGITGSTDAWFDLQNGVNNPGATTLWGARSPQTIDDTVFVAATRNPHLPASGISAEDLGPGWVRLRLDIPGGLDLHASLSNPNAPYAVRQLAENPVVRARADVAFLRIDPAQITHAQRVKIFNGAVHYGDPIANAGFQNVQLTPVELMSAPIPAAGPGVEFDFWVPTADEPNLELNVTGEHVPMDAAEGAVVVFEKQTASWGTYPATARPSDQELLATGFVRGHWEATEFEPQTPEVWVPAPGLHMQMNGGVSVNVEPGWVTTLGGH